MKVGDLVAYVAHDNGGSMRVDMWQGLIISGPGPKRGVRGRQWEVYWLDQQDVLGNIKTGWWDEYNLEVINEAR